MHLASASKTPTVGFSVTVIDKYAYGNSVAVDTNSTSTDDMIKVIDTFFQKTDFIESQKSKLYLQYRSLKTDNLN
jgi:hypothetical protein